MSRNSGSAVSARVVNIDDLRTLAQHAVPKVVFNYIDAGAEGESTLHRNRSAFKEVTFRPLTGGRQAAEQAIHRAQAAEFRVLVITIDTSVIGLSEREVRDGMNELLRGSFLSQVAIHAPDVGTATLACTFFMARRLANDVQHCDSEQRALAGS